MLAIETISFIRVEFFEVGDTQNSRYARGRAAIGNAFVDRMAVHQTAIAQVDFEAFFVFDLALLQPRLQLLKVPVF